MKVLVIGGGGREHAVVTSLSKSPKITKLYAAPGNAGIAALAECVPLAATDIDGITRFAVTEHINLVFVTPDDPLSLGLVDKLTAAGIRAFGPVAAGARLEASKSFAKAFMQTYNIPTAGYAVFDDAAAAAEYVRAQAVPPVIKADGLALGKGVVVPETTDEALAAIESIMVNRSVGAGGSRVVLEERLFGREVTVLAFTDGKTLVPMPASQDHKRAYDGDKGPNTGGMGAFAPSPYFTDSLKAEFMENIAKPTLKGLIAEGIDYRGILYFGLMMTDKGLKVIEYNARLGDPETQVVLPLLETDLTEIVEACIDGRLSEVPVKFMSGAGFTVVVAGGEYPMRSSKGAPITIDTLSNRVILFHAGTSRENEQLVTNGGRVFALSATAQTLEDARAAVYAEIDKIHFDGARYRTDIGKA